MARMPGALWKPLAADWNKQPRMRAYDFFCVHTMVGSLVGTDGYFKVGNGAGYGGTESHFGVGPDGTIYQWQDTDFQADANGNGNWHVISSENADTGFPFPKWGGSDVPALTPEQVEANARIAAWLWETHRIPLDIAGSSKPGARGLAVHRYGVPGYAPAGAELWSSAKGKACPGDRRIAQLPAVRDRAKQIASGRPAATPASTGDDELNELQNAALWETLDRVKGITFPKPGTAHSDSHYMPADSLRLVDVANALPRLEAQLVAMNATVKGLVETIAKLAQGDDVDVDALVERIGSRVDAAVSDHTKLVKVQVSVDGADQG